MKKIFLLLAAAALMAFSCQKPDPTPGPEPGPDPDPKPTYEAGWPSKYEGVMLQGFYWDSYSDTQWEYLESLADDIAPYFSLIWVPNSGYCSSSKNMGYLPYKFFDQNSSFGTEAQLRSMIKAYKSRGTGFIADAVLNHHNTDGWFDFPEETYKGEKYQFQSTDIVANDDSGNTARQASSQGREISKNNDTGDGWDGCRDLDHKSLNVQKICKAYLNFLKNDLGYVGFRYDMVKGYSAMYTGMYNESVKAEYSVGEYWENNHTAVDNWLQGTRRNAQIQSAAFDFAFRYTTRDAANSGRWQRLLDESSATTAYRRYAVTFVENHDTELRFQDYQQDPIRKDTLAVNAWLLANPGTPCVFYKHWKDCKKDIKLMIAARQLVKIHNQSEYENLSNKSTCVARSVKGGNGSLLVVCGNESDAYAAPAGYTEILKGRHYRYLVSSDCNTSTWAATVARIEEEEKPYDGPTATIYVSADFSPVYFYLWDSRGDGHLNGGWPGKQITATVEKFSKTWFTQTVPVATADYKFNFIVNQGYGKPQTSNIENVKSDIFIEATLAGSKIEFTDVTKNYVN